MDNFREDNWSNWLYYVESHKEELIKVNGITFYHELVASAEKHIVNCIYEIVNKKTGSIVAAVENLWAACDYADMYMTISKDYIVRNKKTGAIEYDTSK